MICGGIFRSRKKVATLIFGIVPMMAFCCRSFADEVKALQVEKVANTPLAPRLGRISARLEILQQQLEALRKLSDTSSESPFGMQHDGLQSARARGLAQSHFQNGNSARALFLAQEDKTSPDPLDGQSKTQRLRLTYESLRKLGEHAHAARVCLDALRMTASEKKDAQGITSSEVWNLNCALNFSRGVGPDVPFGIRISREEFDTFAFATSLRKGFSKNLVRSVVLASGFANQGRTQDALEFINDDAQHAEVSSVGMPRLLFTRALLLTQLGKTEEALSVFRLLADENSADKKIAKNEQADEKTRRMAQIQLARIFYSRGQFPAAETWYRLALAQRSGAKDPLSMPLKWEFALTLFAQKKYEESFPILNEFMDVNLLSDLDGADVQSGNFYERQALKYRLTALHAAKALTRFEKTRDLARGRLTAMLAFADADSLFVRQSQKSPPTGFDASVETLRALLAIASQYEIKTDDLKSYSGLTKTLRKNALDQRAFRFELAHVLTPADFADTGILDAHALGVLAQLQLAQAKLEQVFWELDIVSRSLWSAESSAVKAAAKNRDEIRRRFLAIEDLVSKVKVSQKESAKFDLMKSNSARVAAAWANVRVSRARLASLMNLSRMSLQKQNQSGSALNPGIKMLAAEEPALNAELTLLEGEASAALLDQRLLALKSELPDFHIEHVNERLTIASESFRALSTLHLRLRKHAAGPADDEFLSRVDSAWQQALFAQKQIVIGLEQALRNARSDRRSLVNDVQALLNIKKTQDAGIEKMKSILTQDGNKWIRDLSERIEKGVREYRNQVRIALALAESRHADDIAKQQADFARAMEERRLWLQSLRQSVDWGLAR